MPVTAEGVETEGVRGKIADLGCTEAQGWLFGRAISAGSVRQFLSNGMIASDLRQGGGEAGPDASPARRAAGG